METQDLEVMRISPAMVINLADQRAVAAKYAVVAAKYAVDAAKYAVDVRTKGRVIEAKILARGEVVSQGRMAVVGATAVADGVQTDPAHRRRGLAATVMHEPVAAARIRERPTGC